MNTVFYKTLIGKYETAASNAILVHGETETTNLIFEKMDKRLTKLYAWYATEESLKLANLDKRTVSGRQGSAK